MTLGSATLRGYRRVLRDQLWSLGGERFGRVALAGALVLLALALWRRLLVGEEALGLLAWGWAALLALAALCWMLSFRPRPGDRRRAAGALDAHVRARGAVLTAIHLDETGGAARLAPLVLRAADRSLDTADLPRAARPRSASLSAALGLAVAGIIVASLPVESGTIRTAIRSEGAAAAVPGAGGGSGAAGTSSARDRSARPDLEELAELHLQTEKPIYLMNERVHAWVTLVPKAGVGEAVSVEIVLGMTDGLPSADVGFGVGIRPLKLRDATLPATPEEGSQRQRIALRPFLERLGMWKPGLLTFEAYAKPSGEAEDLVSGGLVSNQVTIQIAENRTREQIRKPNPSEVARTPDRQDPDPKKDAEGTGMQGGDGPKLGAPDRLPDAARRAEAVKPLLADGPRVQKEVNVFDREAGGAGARTSPEPEVPDSPVRTFLRRAEASIPRLSLSPADREILRRYFRDLDR
jgi:hypothetical protein